MLRQDYCSPHITNAKITTSQTHKKGEKTPLGYRILAGEADATLLSSTANTRSDMAWTRYQPIARRYS